MASTTTVSSPGYRNEALNQVYLVTNNVWNWPVYSALEFAITKHTRDVQLIGSYMRQFQHLAGSWQANDPASVLQPGAFPNNRGIGDVSGSPGSGTDANSLSGTHQTRARQWRDHVVRLGVFYYAPWRLLLATNYPFQSGLWSGPIVTRLNTPDPAYGPPTVRLSNGRLVSNSLATTLRFAFPTRGEGQFKFDSVQIWNVRIGRDVSVKGKRLETALDIFNVMNSDADQFPESGSNQQFSPNYAKATRRQLPRSAQVSLRLEF